MKKTHLHAFGQPTPFSLPTYAAEVARLQAARRQEQLYFTLQGLPSTPTNPPHTPSILSVICGSRGWVFDILRNGQQRHLVNIDESRVFIEYARAHEWLDAIEHAEKRLQQMLAWSAAFPTGSFDVVHLSYVANYTPTLAFPTLFQELGRLCRPGGMMRWDEGELPHTTSPACEQLVLLSLRALHEAGRGCVPCGWVPNARSLGLTLTMKNGLLTAGCHTLRLRHVPFITDVSVGSGAHVSFVQRMIMLARQMRPLLVQAGEVTDEEFLELYDHMKQEIQQTVFQGTCSLHTFWGRKREKLSICG